MASKVGSSYVSSTSSISNPLIPLYYIFSSFRMPLADNIFDSITNKSSNWMVSYRKPTSFYLRNIEDNIQAIVSDHGVMPAAN